MISGSNKKEVLSILLLCISVVWALAVIMSDRKDIPVHIDVMGQVDAVASKWNILIMPATAIFVYALLSFFQSHPEYCNLPSFPEKVDRANLVRKLLLILKLFSILLLVGIEVTIILYPLLTLWIVIGVFILGSWVFYREMKNKN
ncbi:MAG: hypothetical protein SOY99_02860 [Alloprevotella sp.]|nr:hypothetical protein [Bacteroidales bacterium]MDY3943156.1 hypothetical protein [Alloprevotella sp.]